MCFLGAFIGNAEHLELAQWAAMCMCGELSIVSHNMRLV
eukprot:COSAG01_NODE_56481_length_318_cov_0.703196_1_plen_38_part_10